MVPAASRLLARANLDRRAKRVLRVLLAAGITFSACVLAPVSSLAAQPCDCRAPLFPTRWSVFVSTGGALLETTTINSRLGTGGYAAVSDDAIGFGAGGYGSFGPLRIGLEHVRLDAGEESTAGGLFARLEASYTALTLGWDVLPRSRYSIVPTLGVGRGSYVLTVGDVAGGAATPVSPPPTFDEVLAAPGESARIAGGHWVFEPMIAADFLLRPAPDRRRGITLGVRAGYRIAPNRPDWEYRGERASGGPIDQARGPIVRLTIGVGGR
jgi:hypothetical protein